MIVFDQPLDVRINSSTIEAHHKELAHLPVNKPLLVTVFLHEAFFLPSFACLSAMFDYSCSDWKRKFSGTQLEGREEKKIDLRMKRLDPTYQDHPSRGEAHRPWEP